MLKYVTLGISASLLLGCVSPPDLNVRDQWGRALTPLGIQAVYPMRESFYPGDILLYTPNSCGENVSRSPETARLGSVPLPLLRQALLGAYGTQPQFAPSFTAARTSAPAPNRPDATTQALPIFSQPVLDGSVAQTFLPDDATPRTVLRGRLAAFPGVEVASFQRATLTGTLGGGGGLGSFLGLSGERQQRTSITVSQVEELEIPGPIMLNMIAQYLNRPEALETFNPERIREMESAMRLQGAAVPCREGQYPPSTVVFVNRVFYARAIDYDFGQRTALVAEAAVALSQRAIRNRISVAATPSAANGLVQSLETDANEILTALTTLSSGTVPGVSSTIAVGTSGSLVLRQAFDRPLAFGVHVSYRYGLDQLWNRLADALEARQTPQPKEVAEIITISADPPTLTPANRLSASWQCDPPRTDIERLRCAARDELQRGGGHTGPLGPLGGGGPLRTTPETMMLQQRLGRGAISP
ncbi:hypothetical protein EOD42_04755 [Rhodovarius crocodyli]|uniref:Uncharacterized protein n=2 Tax=Rhodovarius crocodyli TaxID=1979269 RepID=A0A437MP61_9PROT|nr:hypothetical protein EOD42_04755 [Rhodovarius crocodyli]